MCVSKVTVGATVYLIAYFTFNGKLLAWFLENMPIVIALNKFTAIIYVNACMRKYARIYKAEHNVLNIKYLNECSEQFLNL